MINVLATAGQTSFTVTGGYRINQISVYRNGVKLAQSRDFLANDGSTVVLLSAATLNDVIAYQIFDDFAAADAILKSSSDQTLDGNLNVTGTITGLTSVRGSSIGIQSAGTLIGIAQTLNFIGTGNTFVESATGTIDVSISGGGAGAGGTWATFTSGGSGGISTTKKVKIDDDLEVTGVTTSTGGFSIGIQSGGTTISGLTTALNFVGSGTTIVDRGSGSIDISVAGVTSTAQVFGQVWSNPSETTTDLILNEGIQNYSVVGHYAVAVGATITVGVGNSFVVI